MAMILDFYDYKPLYYLPKPLVTKGRRALSKLSNNFRVLPIEPVFQEILEQWGHEPVKGKEYIVKRCKNRVYVGVMVDPFDELPSTLKWLHGYETRRGLSEFAGNLYE